MCVSGLGVVVIGYPQESYSTQYSRLGSESVPLATRDAKTHPSLLAQKGTWAHKRSGAKAATCFTLQQLIINFISAAGDIHGTEK
jgi:hypothetical protein